MRGYSPFFGGISIPLVKIYISYIIINRGKNTFELVGTVINSLWIDKSQSCKPNLYQNFLRKYHDQKTTNINVLLVQTKQACTNKVAQM